MTMNNKVWNKVGGLLLIVCGWLLGGIGFAEPIEHPWNTICFLLMFPLIPFGIYIVARK